ncbi:MAG TPA: GPW/gp25 family protein [Chthoniobacter sp.]|nr:GPW/gp25 family protein [Chthoniobacter sp.]
MTPSEAEHDEALGTGLAFPLRLNPHGGLERARGEDRIRQSIVLILSTAKGERVMRPDFGCDIHRFVFATLDTVNLTLIKSAVREALVLWEPRIALQAVEVEVEPAGSRLLISVEYQIRLTNARGNLVYPFYLDSAHT